MQPSLADAERHFAELNERLMAPDLAAKTMLELTRERARLEPLVTTWQSVNALQQELADNRALLQDDDLEMRGLAREEIARLEPAIDALETKLRELLLPRDPLDEKDVILEIRAGTGGDEAAIFAGDLFTMYTRHALSQGWKVELLSASEGTHGGFKEVTASVSGDQVYSKLRFEAGVHRVQRVPATETQGRIHTSACTVAVLPEVVVVCMQERSQQKNRQIALKLVASKLFDMRLQEQNDAVAADRKAQVKSGDRSDKIRTYNYPQDRITDHRVGHTVHNINKLMAGEIEDFLGAVRSAIKAADLVDNASS